MQNHFGWSKVTHSWKKKAVKRRKKNRKIFLNCFWSFLFTWKICNSINIKSSNHALRNTNFRIFFVSRWIIVACWCVHAARCWEWLTPRWTDGDRNTLTVARKKRNTNCVRIVAFLWNWNAWDWATATARHPWKFWVLKKSLKMLIDQSLNWKWRKN